MFCRLLKQSTTTPLVEADVVLPPQTAKRKRKKSAHTHLYSLPVTWAGESVPSPRRQSSGACATQVACRARPVCLCVAATASLATGHWRGAGKAIRAPGLTSRGRFEAEESSGGTRAPPIDWTGKRQGTSPCRSEGRVAASPSSGRCHAGCRNTRVSR